MRVIHVYHYVRIGYGGPAEVVLALCRNLNALGCLCSILTLNYVKDVSSEPEGLNIIQCANVWRALKTLRNLISSSPHKVDIVHLHGVWLPLNWYCFELAHYYGVKIIISPHGVLNPSCIKYDRMKMIKKKIALNTYVRRMFNNASCIHATSEEEVNNIYSMNLKVPICKIPYGVYVEEFTRTPDDKLVEEIKSITKNKRVLLFLSRIHPIKGLINLAQAWQRIVHDFPEWCLIIAGPDEEGHLSEVKAAMADAQRVYFLGQVGEQMRLALYHVAELFVLPSFSENFGLVIAESLASGTPVITTRYTPWEELVKYGAGWWIDLGVEPLVSVLRIALSKKPEQLAAMGKRGQELMTTNYNWSSVAQDMINVYQWMLGESPPPSCVRI